MTQTSKTPASQTGALRDQFGHCSRNLSSLDCYRTQFLAASLAIGPERAAMLAALAFEERSV